MGEEHGKTVFKSNVSIRIPNGIAFESEKWKTSSQCSRRTHRTRFSCQNWLHNVHTRCDVTSWSIYSWHPIMHTRNPPTVTHERVCARAKCATDLVHAFFDILRYLLLICQSAHYYVRWTFDCADPYDFANSRLAENTCIVSVVLMCSCAGGGSHRREEREGDRKRTF